MRELIFSYLCLLVVVSGAMTLNGCSGSSSSGSDDRLSPTNATLSSRRTTENLDLLTGLLSKEVTESDKFLNEAEKLEYKEYGFQKEISLDECERINRQISANYKLHRFEVIGDKGSEFKQGVDLCPNSTRKFDYPVDMKNFKIYLSSERNQTLSGLTAVRMLTIQTYPVGDGEYTPVLRQYLLDEQYKILETSMIRHFRNGSTWWEVASLTPEGHVLGRVVSLRDDYEKPYLWKRVASFSSRDGSTSLAMRVVQNDGKGHEVTRTSYRVPHEYKFDSYELSPLLRLGGLYAVGSDVTDWPRSQAVLEVTGNAAGSCARGHIGFTDRGDEQRIFGDQTCTEKMDVQTTVR